MKYFKNLFIIGAQRSGSTFLYHLLDSHPNIHMMKPVFPESKIFIKSPDLNKSDFINIADDIKNEVKIIGEKSTSYYENLNALQAIKKFNSDSKIIFIMRNPVERAISNYFYSLNNGIESRSIEEVFITKKPDPVLYRNISVNPFNYLGRGEYHQYVSNILSTFDMTNVLFLQLENFHTLERAQTQLTKIETFLDISTFPDLESYSKRVNEAVRADTIPENVYAFLYNYFESFNENLRETIHIDISLWKR